MTKKKKPNQRELTYPKIILQIANVCIQKKVKNTHKINKKKVQNK